MNIHRLGAWLLPASLTLYVLFSSHMAFAQAALKTVPLSKQDLARSGWEKNLTLSHRPWDLSPTFKNRLETAKVPGWIDPVPEEFESANPKWSLDLKEILKRPLPKLVRTPIAPASFPKLPWYDLKRIPKIPIVEEKLEEKILKPMIAASFAIDGRIALFKTTDEHLYYVVPNRWLVSLNGLTIDRPRKAENAIRMRFLLSPSYAWADELIAQIRSEDPLAFFVPIPKKFVEFRLDVPGVIGEVRNQILPTDSMSIGDQIYMNVELNDEQLEIFRLLNEANTFLTGSVTFTYPYDKSTNFQLVSDIWLNFQGF